MKYIVSISLVVIVAFGITLWTSCDKTTCENIVCSGNNTYCQSGQCVCQQGYEGPNCDTYSYEKYVGNYQVSENCTTTLSGNQNNVYNMYISQGYSADRVVINGFLGLGSIDATINNNDIYISSQSIGATTVQGYGQYFPNQRQLKLEYSYTQGSQYAECTAILTKL